MKQKEAIHLAHQRINKAGRLMQEIRDEQTHQAQKIEQLEASNAALINLLGRISEIIAETLPEDSEQLRNEIEQLPETSD